MPNAWAMMVWTMGCGAHVTGSTPPASAGADIAATSVPYTLACGTIADGAGVTSNGSIVLVGQDIVGPMSNGSYSVQTGVVPCLVAAAGPPTPAGDIDLCLGGANTGLPCSQASDCPGGACHTKNRYLSITPSDLSATPSVIQVTAVSLPTTATALYNLSLFNGDVWYAGAPQVFSDGVGAGTFKAAPLQCGSAEFRDWSDEGLIHLFGAIVVPGATYQVRACTAIGGSCSAALTIQTAKHGDVVAPLLTAQPSFVDIAAVIDTFRSLPVAVRKTRSQMQPNVPNPANSINFLDISHVVTAFAGGRYPFPAASCP